MPETLCEKVDTWQIQLGSNRILENILGSWKQNYDCPHYYYYGTLISNINIANKIIQNYS